MNTLRLLICVGLVAAMQPVLAEQVNRCRDASGRELMTDRPCGDPSLERIRAQRPANIVVEQIEAEDIFRARNEVRNDGRSISPAPTDGVAKPEVVNKRGLL